MRFEYEYIFILRNRDNNDFVKGFKGEIRINKLNKLIHTTYTNAEFDFKYKHYTTNDLEINYKLTEEYMTQEEGTFRVKKIGDEYDEEIEIVNDKTYEYTNFQIFPKFSLTINPKPKPKIKERCGYGVFEHDCLDQPKEDEELIVDADTVLNGEYTWEGKLYKINIKKRGKSRYVYSKRRNDNPRFKNAMEQINMEFDGVIKGNSEEVDLLIGYKRFEDAFQSKVIILEPNESKAVVTRLNSKRSFFHLKDLNGNKLIDAEFDLGEQSFEAYYKKPNNDLVRFKLFTDNTGYHVEALVKPKEIAPVFCQVLRFCQDYSADGNLFINPQEKHRASLQFYLKRGVETVVHIDATTRQSPLSLTIDIPRYMPTFLSPDGSVFELEVEEDANNYIVTKASMTELQGWRAVKTDNDIWVVYIDQDEIFKMNIIKETDEMVKLATILPDNRAMTTKVTFDNPEWLSDRNGIKFELMTPDGSERSSKADIKWDVSSTSNIGLSIESEGRSDIIGNFEIVRKIVVNNYNSYLELYLKSKLARQNVLFDLTARRNPFRVIFKDSPSYY